MNCKLNCNLYSKCKKPCPQIEAWVNKDYCRNREQTVGRPSDGFWPACNKSKRQLIIEFALIERKPNKWIKENLYLDNNYVERIISEALSVLRSKKWK